MQNPAPREDSHFSLNTQKKSTPYLWPLSSEATGEAGFNLILAARKLAGLAQSFSYF
jgi:hypothetical protein